METVGLQDLLAYCQLYNESFDRWQSRCHFRLRSGKAYTMADTIARLIFEANTAELKKANAELKKLAQESGKAAKSVNDGTKAKKKSGNETEKLTEKEKKLACLSL